MKSTLNLRGFVATAMNLAVIFFFSLLLVTSCNTEDDAIVNRTESKPNPTPDPDPTPDPGPEKINFFGEDFTMCHSDWEHDIETLTREEKFSGSRESGEAVDGNIINRKATEVSFTAEGFLRWKQPEEKIGEILKFKRSFVYRDADGVSKDKDGITFNPKDMSFVLNFQEGESLEILGQYWIPTLDKKAGKYCRLDSISYVSTSLDTIWDETIASNGKDYVKAEVSMRLSLHQTHMNGTVKASAHAEEFLVKYNRWVPFTPAQPGEVKEGRTEIVSGFDKYELVEGSLVENGNIATAKFRSERKFRTYFTQDDKTWSDEYVIDGIANVRFYIGENGEFIVEDIKVSSPSMTPSSSSAASATDKGSSIEAILKTYSFPFAWANGFKKVGGAEVEELYYVRNGKRYELPTSSANEAYSKYVPGASTEVNGYDVYKNGIMFFNATHGGETFGLSVNQVFKVKVATPEPKDEMKKEYIEVSEETTSTPGVIKHIQEWSLSGKKEIARYSFSSEYSFETTDETWEGSSLSNPSQGTKGTYTSSYSNNNGIYSATVVDTLKFKYSLGTNRVINRYSRAYIISPIDGSKISFKLRTSSVSFTSLNSPKEVVDGQKITLPYIATYKHSSLGSKTAKLNVWRTKKQSTIDEEILFDLTIQKGGQFITWKSVNGSPVAVIGATIICKRGVLITFFQEIDKNGKKTASKEADVFFPMDVTSLKGRVGAVLSSVPGFRWEPSYIEVTSGNELWKYTGVNGAKGDINGAAAIKILGGGDKLKKPFISTTFNGQGTETYQYSDGTLIIKYNGKEVFKETFAN